MPTDSAPQGRDDELIERLHTAMQHVGAQHGHFFENTTIYVCMDLGVPLSRNPGQDLARLRDDIAARLMRLTDHGVSEQFLVRAVRERVSTLLAAQADVGEVGRRRAEARDAGHPIREISPDEAAGFWAVREAWESHAASIADDAIEHWHHRRLTAQLDEARRRGELGDPPD